MDFLRNASNIMTLIDVVILMLIVVIDNVLMVIVKIRNPMLDNEYFIFHRKHGFIKITFLKLIVICYMLYALLAPTLGSGGLVIVILAYGLFVISLLIDFFRKSKPESDP